jgi:DNA repair protein RadB
MISSCSSCIDNFLGGGLSPSTVSLIYGEAETGKTTLAMQCAVSCALKGYRVLFVDCDNTFSERRLSQVAAENFNHVAELIILMKPSSFIEQAIVVDHLGDYVTPKFGLVVFDTVTSLYRAHVASNPEKAFSLNRELNRQLAVIAQTSKVLKLPVLLISQVSSIFDEGFTSVAPVANRVVKFWADNIIAIKLTENSQVVKAVVEKAANLSNEKTCYLFIDITGIHDYPFHE